MPAYIKLKVEAVRPGYPHQIRLQYPEPFWSAMGEPAGCVGTSGVKLFDAAAVNHRARVWA